jgi:hypothetical protein
LLVLSKAGSWQSMMVIWPLQKCNFSPVCLILPYV